MATCRFTLLESSHSAFAHRNDVTCITSAAGSAHARARACTSAPAGWNRVQARGNVIAAFPCLFLFVFRFSSDLAGREGAGRPGSSPFRDPPSRFAVRGSSWSCSATNGRANRNPNSELGTTLIRACRRRPTGYLRREHEQEQEQEPEQECSNYVAPRSRRRPPGRVSTALLTEEGGGLAQP